MFERSRRERPLAPAETLAEAHIKQQIAEANQRSLDSVFGESRGPSYPVRPVSGSIERLAAAGFSPYDTSPDVLKVAAAREKAMRAIEESGN